MDQETLTLIGMGLALCALPFAIGISQPRLRTAILLAVASYCGLYATAWSALGALFLPLAGLLITQFELATVLVLSFLGGLLQVVLIAALGFGVRQLIAGRDLRSATRDACQDAESAGASRA